MNPYLTIPIALPGAEAIGDKKAAEDKVVDCKILPGNVIAYHEGYSWGTFLYLTTGQAFCSTLTVKEYEARVRAYWQALGAAAAGNVKRIQTGN